MNKTTKHYFINLFKRKKKILALYTFICFMGYPFLEIASLIANENDSILLDITNTSFALSLFVLGILAAVLPIFTFKFSHTKKHVDTYFAIPINRNHLFKSHFIAPILGTCIPLLASYLVGGLIVVFFRGTFINYFEMLGLLLLAFVMFAIVYSINTYFVLNTNNVIDSSIITAGVAVLPVVLTNSISWFIDSQIVSTGMIEYIDFTNMIFKILWPYHGFAFLMTGFRTNYTHLEIDFSVIEWGYIIYYFILGAIFYYLAKQVFKKKKGENAEQLTTSFVTYPLMINLGMISLALMFNLAQMDIMSAIFVLIGLFVAYMVAQAIANRSFSFSYKLVLKFVLLIVVINGFNFISKETEFFGINRQTIDYTKYDYVDIYYQSYYSGHGLMNYDGKEYEYRIEINELNENETEFFELFKEYQIARSISFKKAEGRTVYGNLNIIYGYDDGVIEYSDRSAYFDLTKTEETKLLEILEPLMEK